MSVSRIDPLGELVYCYRFVIHKECVALVDINKYIVMVFCKNLPFFRSVISVEYWF